MMSKCIFPEIELIAGVKLINNFKFKDSRGFFAELYNKEQLKKNYGIESDFVQDNYSVSNKKNVIRGLHFQVSPFKQAKLVTVIKGRILDIIVDIRVNSPTYKCHMKVEISEGLLNQVYIPAGFAHGFCTLEDDTRVMYKVTAPYSPEYERGILWNDPELQINWPLDFDQAIISEKDKNYPKLKDLQEHILSYTCSNI